MPSLLEDPAVQAGVAPLLAALLVGGALLRTRFAWLAIVAAIATASALTIGIAFSPLTAARKVLLLVLVAPLVGIALDARMGANLPRSVAAIAALFGLASVWIYWSVLSQRELALALALGGGVTLFVVAVVASSLRLRDDGAAGGAATVALGLAVGACAFVSASAGNLTNGVALAAGGGAMLLLQFVLNRAVAPGHLGMLTSGLAAALFAATTFLLAQLPWFVLPLLLLPPLAAGLPVARERPLRARLVAASACALGAAALPVLAAWLATRAASS
jgi:hypothetical protein